jgi:glycosyltransferase involved in cell wall biosynthesis
MGGRKLNILFLTARYPYPVVGGDRLKPYNIISYLARHHNLTLVSFFQGNIIPQDYIEQIENRNIRVFAIPLNPIKAGLRAVSKSASYPLEIGYYTQPEFKETVDKLLQEEHFDLGFSFFMRTAEYLKSKNIKKILMAEDCRTLYQKRSYEKSNSMKQKAVRLWEYRKLLKYEPEIVNHFDVTTLVTHEDISAMKSQNSHARYELLTNGTDIHKFIPSESRKDKTILFAGKLDVWANEMMIMKIIDKIFPIIKNRFEGVKLNIVGANPPKTILARQDESIKVIPNVPDMLPYLQESTMFLHPHDGGSGIQNKLLEAMACGCPVVTTKTGNQGINAKPSEEVLIGNNPLELAEGALRILSDKDLAKRISENARKLIVDTHSWESVFSDLDKLIDDVLNNED